MRSRKHNGLPKRVCDSSSVAMQQRSWGHCLVQQAKNQILKIENSLSNLIHSGSDSNHATKHSTSPVMESCYTFSLACELAQSIVFWHINGVLAGHLAEAAINIHKHDSTCFQSISPQCVKCRGLVGVCVWVCMCVQECRCGLKPQVEEIWVGRPNATTVGNTASFIVLAAVGSCEHRSLLHDGMDWKKHMNELLGQTVGRPSAHSNIVPWPHWPVWVDLTMHAWKYHKIGNGEA